nr:MAG TPA: putative alternative thymidylate synthase [Caudoviricetes sp.]
MILSEHSPLRELEFDIKMYGIPYWVSNHFVRHVHAQPFVSTSRPDITGSKVSRHDMRQDDLVNLQLSLNAQEIINISKLRLCNKASKETREVWYKVIDELVQIEPYLASACVPQCVYRGFCPEPKSCGRSCAGTFKYHRQMYIKQNIYIPDETK